MDVDRAILSLVECRSFFFTSELVLTSSRCSAMGDRALRAMRMAFATGVSLNGSLWILVRSVFCLCFTSALHAGIPNSALTMSLDVWFLTPSKDFAVCIYTFSRVEKFAEIHVSHEYRIELKRALSHTALFT